MTLYRACLVLHVGAALLWLGHMFFWSLFSGPGLKGIAPPEEGDRLRRLSLRGGGLGWPALAVLVVTGATMLDIRGVGLTSLVSGAFLSLPFGRVLGAKLLLVAAMIVYQAAFGHRSAPRAVYANMAAALGVLGLSVALAG
ncbi:MAG: hypothetical protein ACRELC_10200 [Gemmatimonadota bacterium]